MRAYVPSSTAIGFAELIRRIVLVQGNVLGECVPQGDRS
jgi:hypothetical protein